MASISNSNVIFGFTSPRTIEKIIPEIRLLIDKFEGKTWIGNDELQTQFFNLLFESGIYEGDSKPKNITLAARDRVTRAPKALGFIDLSPVISLTHAGQILLSSKNVSDIIARQLLKFQLPSPYHKDKSGRFFVKPYLEILRLIDDMNGLKKHEVAMFALQLTHLKNYERVKEKILAFREKATLHQGNRKAFIEAQFDDEISFIYADDIKRNRFNVRETQERSFKKFIAAKKSNMRDYADAIVRYLRATELITFQDKDYRIVVSEFRRDDVAFILKTIPREPSAFATEEEFKRYLFDGKQPALRRDQRETLLESLTRLNVSLPENAESMSTDELKRLLEETETQIKAENLKAETLSLKSYREYEDVLALFERILKRDVPDPALYLEWNVWRALAMLNYALEVKGNFTVDFDNVPLANAQGNLPDIECEYDAFQLIVEVTMSSGNRQYEMEGEPVARHYGRAREKSQKPVFCLFIAPKISEGALAHFFNLNRMNTRLYGGKTQIIPISLSQFVGLIQRAKEKSFSEPQKLAELLFRIIRLGLAVEDEIEWSSQIDRELQTWLS